MKEHIIIIGGGGTGAALAHDLILRGFVVSLFEKGEFFSGTTGRHHGLLHSGARYAVDDQEAAQECIIENEILRHLAPQAIEPNDGLFVAITEEDVAFADRFLEACAACGIPTRRLWPELARQIEPALTPDLKFAIQVPDATMDAWRLPLHFLATAHANGAQLFNFSKVVELHQASGNVQGVKVRSYATQQEYDLYGDLVVNATGAWAGNINRLAGIDVPIQPGPGVMVAINTRITNMVINRLHPAGEGDINIPQRKLSILGTSLWLADNPDEVTLPPDHIQRMYDLCSQMVPAVKDFPMHSAWSASPNCCAVPVRSTPRRW